jgi:hypothetical protein
MYFLKHGLKLRRSHQPSSCPYPGEGYVNHREKEGEKYVYLLCWTLKVTGKFSFFLVHRTLRCLTERNEKNREQTDHSLVYNPLRTDLEDDQDKLA